MWEWLQTGWKFEAWLRSCNFTVSAALILVSVFPLPLLRIHDGRYRSVSFFYMEPQQLL